MNEEIEKRQSEAPEIANTDGLVKSELIDPEIVAGYAKILPGSNERIFKMIEVQVRHRQWIEKVETISKCSLPLLGLAIAAVITLLCFIAGVLFLFFGYGISANVFFGLTLLGLVSTFINGTKNK